jgi:hypothetical protein
VNASQNSIFGTIITLAVPETVIMLRDHCLLLSIGSASATDSGMLSKIDVCDTALKVRVRLVKGFRLISASVRRGWSGTLIS